MFFYKDGALFQSRLYPADTGNAADVSELFRHLVQKAVARCLREPNLWYLKTPVAALCATGVFDMLRTSIFGIDVLLCAEG